MSATLDTDTARSLAAVLDYLGDERADYDRAVAAGDIEPGSEAHVWTHVLRVRSWLDRSVVADDDDAAEPAFTFIQLSADAQTRALDEVMNSRFGQWQCDSDGESVRESIVYGLAGAIKAPGWDAYGEGDFPGIKGIALSDWDLDRTEIEFDGALTPESAPGLPWPADCDRFRLGRDEARWTGGRRGLWIADSYPEWPADSDRPDVAEFLAAWDAAVAAALAAGRAEYDYQTGPDCARDWLELNDTAVMFTAEGDIVD